MKKFNIPMLAALVAVVFAGVSCKKWIDPEINTDPNAPAEMYNEYLLAPLQVGMAFQLYGGGYTALQTSIYTQHHDGIQRQALQAGSYASLNTDLNNAWLSAYSETGMGAYDLIRSAEAFEGGSDHFEGAAQIMYVLNMLALTDLYGDVPYSEAFQGQDGNFTPSYDSQADIYSDLDARLSNAIASLEKDPSEFVEQLAGDIIYGNSASQWIKAAYAIRARIAIHLQQRDGDAAYDKVIDFTSKAFTSTGDDMKVNFSASQQNPFYTYWANWGKDFSMGKFFIDLLNDVDGNGFTDPRLQVYADTAVGGVYVGSNADNFNASASPPLYYVTPSTPIYFISYAEVKFMEAEAKLQRGDAPGAATAYNEGVRAAAEMVGLDITANAGWLAAIGSETAGSLTMDMIAKQKYIALYGQLEAYNDARRITSNIGLTPVVGASTIPMRYEYPLDEANYNPDNYELVSQFDRVWWNQ